MTVNEKIAAVREKMSAKGISAFVVPSNDPHQSEYVSSHWKTRAYLSGFTGSAGTVVITDSMSGLWTDGRYYVQAANELEGSEMTLFRAAEPDCPTPTEYLSKNLAEKAVVGLNGKLFSAKAVKDMEKKYAKKGITIDCNLDFGNEVWETENRPAEDLTEVYHLPIEYSGKSAADKIKEVREKLKDLDAEAIVVSRLDNIAWLYNIRANDVENTPVVIAYAYVSPSDAILFTNTNRVPDDVKKELANNGVSLQDYNAIYSYIESEKNKLTVLCDETEVNYSLYQKVKENPSLTIKEATDPIALMKGIKNETETKNTYEAYIKDGCAEAEFYGWLFEALENGETITEYSASEKLAQFRTEQDGNKGDSFTAIIAYRENAAMMHYAPSADCCKVIERSHLLLNDSGGQYWNGTTDTTRTFAVGEVTDTERHDYTLVLQAVIALSSARFKEGTTGSMLDVLSRGKLWQEGLDYRCGTGHGVGYLLNVHEGPHSFSDKNTKLVEGMVLTIEPGIYTEGSHGIRTENTAVVMKDEKTEYGQFYHFDTFTVVPIDTACLDLSMMSDAEIKWLNDYNKHVYEVVSPRVSERAKKWLEKSTKPVSR